MYYINIDAHKTVSWKALPPLFCLVQTEFLAPIKQSSLTVSPYLPHTVKLDFHFLCEIQHMYVCVFPD